MIGPVPPAREAVPTSRRPGRPRDARADEVILDAAASVLAEHGPQGFSVDAVASRAGVGKATIYRRWSSRGQLMLDTAQLATPDIPDPDTGSVREDLMRLTLGLLVRMRDTPAGRMLLAVMAEAAVNPEMREQLKRFVQERRSRAVNAVRRGIERGELRSDIDVDLVVDLVAGPVFQRLFLNYLPVDEALVERTVDAVLRGVARPT
jgi:AcrR family transcriptional regulator